MRLKGPSGVSRLRCSVVRSRVRARRGFGPRGVRVLVSPVQPTVVGHTLEASECPHAGAAEREHSRRREKLCSSPENREAPPDPGRTAAEQLDGAAAHVPEEPACPRNLCVRDPCVVRGPCARGARVPMEPVCPRSACARGVCGIRTCEFAPDLKSGSCRAGTVRTGPFTSREGPALFQSTDGGCLKTHMRMFLGLYLRKKSKEEVWWTSGQWACGTGGEHSGGTYCVRLTVLLTASLMRRGPRCRPVF